MAHGEDPAASFADYGENLFQYLVKDFVGGSETFFVQFPQALGVSICLVGNATEAVVDALAEFIGLGAQLLVRELFCLVLTSVYCRNPWQKTFDFALVLGPEDLA